MYGSLQISLGFSGLWQVWSLTCVTQSDEWVGLSLGSRPSFLAHLRAVWCRPAAHLCPVATLGWDRSLAAHWLCESKEALPPCTKQPSALQHLWPPSPLLIPATVPQYIHHFVAFSPRHSALPLYPPPNPWNTEVTSWKPPKSGDFYSADFSLHAHGSPLDVYSEKTTPYLSCPPGRECFSFPKHSPRSHSMPFSTEHVIWHRACQWGFLTMNVEVPYNELKISESMTSEHC